MQKKLIALAVAAAVAVPTAAIADVKIYGQMHASWDFIDTDDMRGDDSDDNTGIHRASRLGFKGSENLGNGLKTIWQIETQLNTATAGAAFTLRNTFVGLNGDWGTVLLGRHDSPYKRSTAALDIFGDTIADYNNTVGRNRTGLNDEERFPQTVMYISPDFNGFHAEIARESHKFNEDPAGAYSDDETEAWSLMGQYKNGPWFAAIAYEDQSGGLYNSTQGSAASTAALAPVVNAAGTAVVVGGGTVTAATSANESDAWRVGLGYSFGNSKVGFVYEDIDHDANNSMADTENWYINFQHKFGANTFKIAYGDTDDSDMNNSNDSSDWWGIGLYHSFSKRTSVYAIYADRDNDRSAALPLHDGNRNGTGTSASGAGRDVDALSVGLIHKF